MNKLFLVLVFFSVTGLFAQSKINGDNSFINDSAISKFEFSKKDNYFVDYQKYLNSPITFSIYNPKPGFNPTKIESQKYYSFKNTNLLLKREMSTIKPEPIYPEQDKKSPGEALVEDVLNALF